jgi:transposase
MNPRPPLPPLLPGGRDVAVDVHKKRLAVIIADAAGNELWRGRLPATQEGEADLLRRLRPADRVVLEATTGATRLANLLEQSGATVLVADPQHNRLVGLRGKKSDWRDCQALLSHLRAGELVVVWRPDATTRALRQLTRERLAYNKSITLLKNRLQMLLWEEGFSSAGNLWTKEGQAWLAEQPLRPAARAIVERQLGVLAALEAAKGALEEELASHAVASEEAQRLLQIVGIGPETAVMLLGEIGEATRFARAAQLVRYAGLNPQLDQSDGPPRQGLPITKAGRRPLRWLMVEAAWTHVRHSGPEAEHFHRLVKRGKPEGVAIVALARRLLVRGWVLLVRAEPDRQLSASRYERKLARLAAHRPWSEAPQLMNVDWAAERLERLTGVVSERRQQWEERAAPRGRRRPSSQRPVSRTAASRPDAAGAPGARSEFPAQARSDPSERAPGAANVGCPGSSSRARKRPAITEA